MVHLSPVETLRVEGCFMEMRRIEGPVARELFVVCRPTEGLVSAGSQGEAIYRAIADVLAREGGDYRNVATEWVFFRDISSDLSHVRAARSRVLASAAEGIHHPARTEIEQPPASAHSHVEVLVHAVLEASPQHAVATSSNELGDDLGRPRALRIQIGDEVRLHAGDLHGAGSDACEQTHAMFGVAERLLRRAGMSFQDVMRTWIYFAEMERDYEAFNRARREFFQARGVDPIPASTGIGAGLARENHHLCLGFYAATGRPPFARSVMTTPTLNEAPDYGSDFSRGMRVDEANRASLYVSGTASLDERGDTVHRGDFGRQAGRMLVNVAGLLEQQGATFGDIVYAITYV